jgi:hypothetical protein
MLQWLAAWCGVLASAIWAVDGLPVVPAWALVLAFAGFWLVPLTERVRDGDGSCRVSASGWFHVAVAGFATWRCITGNLDGAFEMGALLAATFLAAGFHRVGRIPQARTASLVMAAATLWPVVHIVMHQGFRQTDARFLVLALICVSFFLLPNLLDAGVPKWSATARSQCRWLLGATALGIWLVSSAQQVGACAPYVTIGWALAGILLFWIGLALRSAPQRFLGLIGLGLSIPRLFVVDLDSALHRIIAFLALGVILLWIGFSYHRFKHLISGEDHSLPE